MQFVTRSYNAISLNEDDQTITKISEESRLKDECAFFHELKNDQKYDQVFKGGYQVKNYHELLAYWSIEQNEKIKTFFAELIDSCLDHGYFGNGYRLTLKYYPYPNLGSLLKNNVVTIDTWTNIAKALKEILTVFQSVDDANIVYFKNDTKITKKSEKNLFLREMRKNMFVEKTESEFKNFCRNNNVCTTKTLVINDKEYSNFEEIWPSIKKYIEKKYCNKNKMNFIHGDLGFSNILCGLDNQNFPIIRFVDPRGSFGGCRGVFGDYYYDLAKLMHSINGKYDLIITDHYDFSLKENVDNKILFSFKENNCDIVKEVFDKEIFSEYDSTKIKLIEGLLFISMCDRHRDDMRRQRIMYGTGIKILNECLDEINSK